MQVSSMINGEVDYIIGWLAGAVAYYITESNISVSGQRCHSLLRKEAF